MRSPFADKTEEIVPRSLKQLLAADAADAAPDDDRKRRPRKTKTLRRVT
ncbi:MULTISPECIES: hypothetical protein [Actinomadura]|uniref:Transposase n=1 Tax=Actinomadura yumaensis TaxID=111807 RepID=A0ABW2CTZ1_9ACTN|nr:hypothetical protein [Actinomadura sp. J1-007]